MFPVHLLLVCAVFVQGEESNRVVRIDRVVSKLERPPTERRLQLARNPENLSVSALNARVPEIDAVELDNSYANPSKEGPLRVAAWNMERGTHWREGAQLIQSHPALRGADILLLSEMDIGMARSGNVHTVREMAKALRMNYAYAVEFLELPRGPEDQWEAWAEANPWGFHGNAILCRYPLDRVRALRFPGVEKWYGSGEHRLGGRNALFAEITLDDRAVTLCSTHLESGLADHQMRTEQSRMICAEIDGHAGTTPVIVGGDLNAIHTQEAVEIFRENGFIVDACNVLKQGTMQRVLRDGTVSVGGAHIDYLVIKGFEVSLQDTSPTVVPAVVRSKEEEICLGDHAVVTALLRPLPAEEGGKPGDE